MYIHVRFFNRSNNQLPNHTLILAFINTSFTPYYRFAGLPSLLEWNGWQFFFFFFNRNEFSLDRTACRSRSALWFLQPEGYLKVFQVPTLWFTRRRVNLIHFARRVRKALKSASLALTLPFLSGSQTSFKDRTTTPGSALAERRRAKRRCKKGDSLN